LRYFENQAAALRYAAGRPHFHDDVTPLIRRLCTIEGKVDRAIDVGCGTGMSSVAIADLSERVVAVDISMSMLSVALRHPRVRYLCGPAEALPLADREVDLLTAGLALHWFDQPAFFAEAARVLRPGGTIVAYNDWFRGTMSGVEAFAAFNERYLERFPSPARNLRPIGDMQLEVLGFKELGKEGYKREETFTVTSLVGYLLTQSNTISAVDAGRDSVEGVRSWLEGELSAFFGGQVTGRFEFRGEVRAWKRG
jgi:SAM-dependent methyltransferase